MTETILKEYHNLYDPLTKKLDKRRNIRWLLSICSIPTIVILPPPTLIFIGLAITLLCITVAFALNMCDIDKTYGWILADIDRRYSNIHDTSSTTSGSVCMEDKKE
jgi:hypothetical protein